MADIIRDIIKNGTYPPVLLLFGEEEFQVDEAASALYAAAAATDATGMNSDVIDGEGTSMDTVLSIARSYPMMSERRAIWVRRFDKVSASRDRKGNDPLSQYLASPSPTTFLLLTASIPSADGIGAASRSNAQTASKKMSALKFPFNVLLKNAQWQEFPRMKEPQVLSWVRDRTQRLGLTISPEVSDFLLLRCGTSLRDLSMEIDKLRTYIGDRTDIGIDDVNAVVGAGKSYNVFELQRAVGRRDAPAAFTIMTRMMEAERQEILIIAMLTRYFVTLFRLCDVQGTTTDRNEIARLAGMQPYAVADNLAVLDRYGPVRIEAALYALAQADLTIKSSSTDPLVILQTMLTRILS